MVVVYEGADRKRGRENVLEATEIFYVMIGLLATQLYKFVKTFKLYT